MGEKEITGFLRNPQKTKSNQYVQFAERKWIEKYIVITYNGIQGLKGQPIKLFTREKGESHERQDKQRK